MQVWVEEWKSSSWRGWDIEKASYRREVGGLGHERNGGTGIHTEGYIQSSGGGCGNSDMEWAK